MTRFLSLIAVTILFAGCTSQRELTTLTCIGFCSEQTFRGSTEVTKPQ